MANPTLLVLAAGMGSRYGGLKQIDPFGPNGETMIDYAVWDARRAGFDQVVFVIRQEFADAFKDSVGRRFADDIEVGYAFQELDALPEGFTVPEGRAKPWGTGHAILVAKDQVRKPFAVINADDFYGAQSYASAAEFLRAADQRGPDHYASVGYRLQNTLSPHGTVSRGLCEVDDNGKLQGVTETHGICRQQGQVIADNPEDPQNPLKLTGQEIVSMNLWAFTPGIFDHLEQAFEQFLHRSGGELKSEFYIPAVVDQLIRQGQADVQVLTCDAQWFGVTYPQDKPVVQQSIKQLIDAGAYPTPLGDAASSTTGASQ